MAGPGWIIPGALKIMAGAFLAFGLQHEVPIERAAEPTQMYLVAFRYVFSSPEWALAAMVLFVIISQIKINLTNAYAGSLAGRTSLPASPTVIRAVWCGWCSTSPSP